MDEEAIFLEALQRATPAARVAFLDDACAGNPSLRGEVEMLLKAHEKAGRFLQGQPAGLCPTVDQPIAEKPGTQIGPYKLLQQIGEGGMGVVYMAEQKEPVARRVALKIIKPGMDTRQVIARFEAERQALAHDGPPEHRQGARCRHDRQRPAVLRHGTGQWHSRSRSSATSSI